MKLAFPTWLQSTSSLSKDQYYLHMLSLIHINLSYFSEDYLLMYVWRLFQSKCPCHFDIRMSIKIACQHTFSSTFDHFSVTLIGSHIDYLIKDSFLKLNCNYFWILILKWFHFLFQFSTFFQCVLCLHFYFNVTFGLFYVIDIRL